MSRQLMQTSLVQTSRNIVGFEGWRVEHAFLRVHYIRKIIAPLTTLYKWTLVEEETVSI